MGYIDTFSGGTVQSSDTSYALISTQAGNVVLTWPTQFQNTQNVVYDKMNITSGGVAGTSIALPDARLASVGASFVFNNIGANSIQIKYNDLSNLQVINSGAVYEFYLTDNSTQNGLWSIIPSGGGAGGVTQLTVVQPANAFTVTLNPNPGVGPVIQTFTLINDLLALSSLGAGTGFGVRTAANTWATRSLVQGANITITNPAGIAGNSTIALATSLVGLTAIAVGNLNLSASTISGTQANQDIIISPISADVRTGSNFSVYNQNGVKFYNAANTFYTQLTSANPVANAQFFLPPILPTSNGQALVCTTGGLMTWGNVVTPPGATTLNAIARYSNTTGSLANSGVLIDNANNITGANTLTVGNLTLSGSTITGTVAGANILLVPSGVGEVVINSSVQMLNRSLIALYNTANTFYTALQSQNVGASLTYQLPSAGPTNIGQYLTSTVPAGGASTMSWSTLATTLISTQTAVNNASIIFSSSAATFPPFSSYLLVIQDLVPVNNDVQLYITLSNDGGTTWGATGYYYSSAWSRSDGSGPSVANTTGANQNQIVFSRVVVNGGIPNAATRANATYCAQFTLSNVSSGNYTSINGNYSYLESGAAGWLSLSGSATYQNAVAVNGIRITLSAGNIAAGSFSFYGIK